MVQVEDFDDVRLDRTQAELPPRPSRPVWLPLLVSVLLVGGAFWYFLLRKPATDGVNVRTDIARVDAPKPPARSAAEPGDNIAVPPLNETDVLVRELVVQLSTHPRVAAWLTTDQLIRNFTTVVVTVANGQTPAKHLRAIHPLGPFRARGTTGRLVIDSRTYDRYDGHADAFVALDSRGAARLYATLRPRIDEAYKELGAPDGTFDRTLERAIVELLKTPVIEGDVPVKSDRVSYEFASPSLESLSTAQRQLLRMGPRNVKLVKAKLRDVARYLGIPETSLPSDGGAGQ